MLNRSVLLTFQGQQECHLHWEAFFNVTPVIFSFSTLTSMLLPGTRLPLGFLTCWSATLSLSARVGDKPPGRWAPC